MKTKDTYHPDETRAALLNAAFMEIYMVGFQSASLSRILSNVKCTKGALYHHFPNKKTLGLRVVEEIIAVRMHAFFMAPLENTNDPIPILGEIFQKKADILSPQEIRYGCPLNNLTQEMSPIDEDFNSALKVISDLWVRTISEALDRGKTNGKVKSTIDSNGAALFVVASIEGAFGLGTTTDSKDFFVKCMQQLKAYVQSLASQAENNN